MEKTVINAEAGKGWNIFEGSGVDQLIHSDGVCIDTGALKFVYVSGKTATDEAGVLQGADDIKVQTRQVLKNIADILSSVGGTLDDVVRVRVYVRDPLTKEMFGKIHEARAEVFDKAHYPASTMVTVSSLVRDGALIEIDADAVIAQDRSD